MNMLRDQSRQTNVHRAFGTMWLVARWMLVLVLTMDIVSAPFHDHRHASAQGPSEVSTSHASSDHDETHAHSGGQALAAHAAVVIRANPSRVGQVPASDILDTPIRIASAMRLSSLHAQPVQRKLRPARSEPDFRSHRSLPPAGRAPPCGA